MNKEVVNKELKFKAIRSSGAGGQHVNKVSSKVELSFHIKESKGLLEDEKNILYQKLASKLTKEGVLQLYCDTSRSQHKNKELVIQRFFEMIKENKKRPKKRKATKPTRASVQKRIETKKRQSLKKDLRKKIE